MAPEARASSRSGSETRQKQHRITFRLSGSEYAELEAAASVAGLTLGSYIRACVLVAATTRARRRGSVELEALAKALAVVNKMGGNLHQIARHLNFYGIPFPDELVAALVGYEAMVAALMGAIGREP